MIDSGTPPRKANSRTCDASQSSQPWVQFASAQISPEHGRQTTKICAARVPSPKQKIRQKVFLYGALMLTIADLIGRFGYYKEIRNWACLTPDGRLPMPYCDFDYWWAVHAAVIASWVPIAWGWLESKVHR